MEEDSVRGLKLRSDYKELPRIHEYLTSNMQNTQGIPNICHNIPKIEMIISRDHH